MIRAEWRDRPGWKRKLASGDQFAGRKTIGAYRQLVDRECEHLETGSPDALLLACELAQLLAAALTGSRKKRTSFLSYHIAKRLIRVPYISLPNLIADKAVVRELLQDDFSVENLREELQKILSNPDYRATLLAGYEKMAAHVGTQPASATTARLILKK